MSIWRLFESQYPTVICGVLDSLLNYYSGYASAGFRFLLHRHNCIAGSHLVSEDDLGGQCLHASGDTATGGRAP